MTKIDSPSAIQKRASDPTKSVWVSASAGSGKTKVLTDRVLRLLLAEVEPHRLVCLTFTNAAAAEMLSRVMQRLSNWSRMSDDQCAAELHEFDLEATAAQLTRAKGLFAVVLNSSGLKIQTIHSFCQSILGRFPIEAGVSPNFQLLDEGSTNALLLLVKNALISDIESEENHPLRDSFMQLVLLLGEHGFNVSTRDSPLYDLIKKRQWLAEVIHKAGTLEAHLDRLAEALKLDPNQSPQLIKAAAISEVNLPPPSVSSWLIELKNKGSTEDINYAKKLQSLLEQRKTNVAAAFEIYTSIFITGEGTIRKRLGTAKISEKIKSDLKIEAERIFQVMAKLKTVEIYFNTAAILRFSFELIHRYDQLKQARNRLDFDDLIMTTRRLLEKDGGVSWVAYKLDSGIEHLLVDEAQDTSPDQWAVINKIASEIFENPAPAENDKTRAQPKPRRSVFVVGDGKQSIYSFQGADLSVFEQSHAAMTDYAKQNSIEWSEVPFEFSFRSQQEILDSVDSIFNQTEAGEGVPKQSGQPHHHFSQRKAAVMASAAMDSPCVELWGLETSEKPDDPEPWKIPQKRIVSRHPRTRLAEKIATDIAQQITNGARAADIMVLVRSRTTFEGELVRELKARGIAVAGTDRMKLTRVLAVQDLLALMQFVLLPDDDLTLAELLRSPLVGMEEDSLMQIAIGRSGSLWQSLKSNATNADKNTALHSELKPIYTQLAQWLDQADYSPPFEFISRILAANQGRKRLLERLGLQIEEPIEAFLQQLLTFEQDQAPSLQGFLSWFAASDLEIKRVNDATAGEVRIMTIHGAKGLEAPIVYLPQTTTKPKAGFTLFWHEIYGPLYSSGQASDDKNTETLRATARSKQIEEYHRLLYVAMTRAADRLVIGGWLSPPKTDFSQNDKEKSWYQLIASVLSVKPAIDTLNQDEKSPHATAIVPPLAETPEPVIGTPESLTETPSLPAWLWQAAAKPDPRYFPELWRPSDKSRSNRPLPPSQGEPTSESFALKRGIVIHRLLQHLPNYPHQEWQERSHNYFKTNDFGLTDSQQHEIIHELLRLITAPTIAPLFQAEAQVEVALIGRIGNYKVSGRIDRLVIQKGLVTIIDYKTDSHPPSREIDVNKAYLTQMAAYFYLINKLFPNDIISVKLIWTAIPIIMELSHETILENLPK